MAKIKNQLTDRRLRFIDEYIKDGSGKHAAIRAGYAPHAANVQASILLTNPDIRKKVNEKLQKASEKADISAAYVLKSLKEVADICRSNADEKGRIDSAGANRALELLGKYLKLFADRVEHSGVDGKPLQITLMTYRPELPSGDEK